MKQLSAQMNLIAVFRPAILAAIAFLAYSSSSVAAPIEDEKWADSVGHYLEKMKAYDVDLLEIGKGATNGFDQRGMLALWDVANEYRIRLRHIQRLVAINQLIQNDADRKHIRPIIDLEITEVAKGIDGGVKEINIQLGNLRSPSLIATADKLKDDLRALKNLLEQP